MTFCVETHKLSHQFSQKQQVLKEINIQVPHGAVYGFLGPNGAGKTTTLKLILGLIRKQQGEIHVFDKPFQQYRNDILKRTGSLIESPSIYGHLTARENLQIMQKIYQCPKSNIEEVLDLTGLTAAGKKLTKHFSLGMKQRLSIAVALLHQPSLLILDEPTNGLDPNGIIEMRELLKRINEEQGITIIISSHMLAEIEKLVSHVGIISNGSIIFQGTLADLINRQSRSSGILMQTSDNSRSAEIIKSIQLDMRMENDMIILPVVSRELLSRLNRQLMHNGIDVFEISPVKKDLETIFMEQINIPV